MSAIYSKTFVQVHDFSGTSGEFIPPAGTVWILRGLDVVNGEALNEFQLKGAAGQVIWTFSGSTPLGFDYFSYRGRYVVEDGSFFTIFSTKALDVSVWGYELTAP